MHEYRNVDEWVFSILLNVEKTEVSRLKEYKIYELMKLLNHNNDNYHIDTYDEYYEDIDETLRESNWNFFEELYTEDDRLFDCGGVLDDDDLNDFDNLVVINNSTFQNK